jgi:predicted permease
MIIVGLVLVVACSNLAGLLLMRSSSRRKEMALRQALGAGRWRLVSLFLTESALLGLLGGAVGLLIAFWTAGAILAYKPPFPVTLTFDFRMDERVLVFNLLLSIATGILFGLAPALKASRCDLVSTIKDDVPTLGTGRMGFTLRNFFVVVQVAVSLVLLIGAGLFIRNLSHWRQIDPGFETERTALAVVDVSRAGYDTEEKGRSFFERYRENLVSSAGVEMVATASRVPLGLWGMDRTSVRLHDAEPAPEEETPRIDFVAVSQNYFDTLGIPILRGRGFGPRDTLRSRKVAVVSEAMARRYFDSTDVIGQMLILGASDQSVEVEVIGVARDTIVRSVRSAQREPDPYIYLPFSQRYMPVLVFVAKTTGDPAAMTETFRRELRSLDYRVPLFESKTMKEHLSLMLYIPRMTVLLLTSFGLLALALASIGLYGLVAFSVVQRTREVGIRIALGAQTNQVVSMILMEGVKLVAVGAFVGLAVAGFVTRPLSVLFIDLSPTDPMTFAAVALLLLGVTVFAAYIPARRAARSDPMGALRHE